MLSKLPETLHVLLNSVQWK